MKTYNKLIIFALSILLFNACDQKYIDGISTVDPGADASAPAITVKYPLQGTQIKLPEVVSSVEIKFEVTDDIEIATVKVMYDGSEIASYSDFKDYRRLVVDTLSYDNVVDGPHKLSFVATDIDNKTTTVDVNFDKSPPYVAKYPGEILYMPFEGDFMNMVTFKVPTVVGNPGFSDKSVVGSKSYDGAQGSYLTLPATEFQSNELTAIFWMKVNAVPDRAGILVMGPEDTANAEYPVKQNNRKNGFRFFRENAAGKQRFKLNVGNGTADSWVDGGTAADVDPTVDNWVHLAFTITANKAIVYIDGQIVKESDLTGLDWTGCDVLSIMSGAPRFTGWSHLSDESLMDELRMFNRVLTQEEIQTIITEESGKNFTYTPKYDGEIFYMPFEDNFKELVTQSSATEVGTPGFAAGKVGQAYLGTTASYLTFPTDGLKGNQISAAFWMKINATPDRAGILVMGPEDTANAEYPVKQNNRKSGFRFFREKAGDNQRFKLNAGNGTADTWFDGGTAADVDPTTGTWRHLAFTISGTEAVVYVDGEVVKQGDFTGINWDGCDILSIMSGAPRFSGWDHLSDLSLMDELRLFNKALSQAEVKTIMNDEM
jgi:hypothetical protein